MHELAEPEAVAVAATPDAARSALEPTAARALALQRTVGNRAATRLIAPRPLARETTKVSEFVKEETTGTDNVTWWAKYDVSFDEDTKTCWVTIRLNLVPDAAVSADDLKQVRIGLKSRFSLLWDGRFSLHEHRNFLVSDRDWLLRPQIEFTDEKPHLTVHLHDGVGKSNRQSWYVMKGRYDPDPKKAIPAGYAEVEHAHEVSHQLGLLDEYEDPSVVGRKTYTDNSLLGDYANEGYDKVRLQLRHGERLAKIIGTASDKDLKATMARTN